MANGIHQEELLLPELSYSIVGAAIAVHNDLGPGWDEWDYHRAMIRALEGRGHNVASHARRNLIHRGEIVDGFELDILVDDSVILELKHIKSSFHPEHYVQLINYLKCWSVRLGILMNFGLERLYYKRIPYDSACAVIVESGHWTVLAKRIPLLCRNVEMAVERILLQYGYGYGVSVFEKLLLAELGGTGVDVHIPIMSPVYEGQDLGERKVGCICVDSELLISVSATGQNASAADRACLRSYMRQTGIENGLLIDIGNSEIKLKGVV